MATQVFTEVKRHTSISHVRVDQRGVDEVLEALRLTPAAITRATQRALRKLGQWLLRKVQRDVSKTEHIALNVLRHRFRVYADSRVKIGLAVKAWFGTRPIPADRLGNPRQTRTGVRVGKRSFPHAFLASMYNVGAGEKRKGVWQRVETAGSDKRIADPQARERIGKKVDGRFPIFKPKIVIDDAVRAALRGLESELEARFMTLLKQELNYENLKAQNRALRLT